jgi:hypothetical protein
MANAMTSFYDTVIIGARSVTSVAISLADWMDIQSQMRAYVTYTTLPQIWGSSAKYNSVSYVVTRDQKEGVFTLTLTGGGSQRIMCLSPRSCSRYGGGDLVATADSGVQATAS